jgi:hypothetical protein
MPFGVRRWTLGFPIRDENELVVAQLGVDQIEQAVLGPHEASGGKRKAGGRADLLPVREMNSCGVTGFEPSRP